MKDTLYILSSNQKPNGRLLASIAGQNGHLSNVSSFGVDTPTAPPLTGDEAGDEGGVTPSSENSLHFKMIFVPGDQQRGQVIDLKLCPSLNLQPRFIDSDVHLQANSTV